MGPIDTRARRARIPSYVGGPSFWLRRAMGAWRKWNIDVTRHEVELVPPVDYLRMSYYERQFAAFLVLLQKRDFITAAEIKAGVPAPESSVAIPALTREGAAQLVVKGVPTSRDVSVPAKFQSGQKVRAINANPVGHTREPRYVRGKLGTIERDHGVFVFPDTNAHFLGETPQHVYSVRFSARELWGNQAAPQDSVYVDLWDDYLGPA